MSIFNSLGSNYDLKFAWQALTAKNHADATNRLKSFLNQKYRGKITLVNKGRWALNLALKALNLPEGSYVAINGYTCYALYEAVSKARYKIEYVDISQTHLDFSVASLEQKLKNNPSIMAVVIQNTLGYPCDIEQISNICRRHNIILIEDLAHSVGTIYKNGKEAGTVGDFVVLSFSQDKIIDAVCGGALIIRNKKYMVEENFENIDVFNQWRDRLYPFLTLLIRKTYDLGIGKIMHALFKLARLLSMPMNTPGGIRNLPHWYSSLALSRLQELESNLSHRREIASIYAKYMNQRALKQTIVQEIAHATNLRFPIFIQNRAQLINYLKKERIYISDIWFDAPIAPKSYMHLTNYKNECPQSEKTSREILNLPTHRNISIKQAQIICEKINKWLLQQN